MPTRVYPRLVLANDGAAPVEAECYLNEAVARLARAAIHLIWAYRIAHRTAGQPGYVQRRWTM